MSTIFSWIYDGLFKPDPINELKRARLLDNENQDFSRLLLEWRPDGHLLALALRKLINAGLLNRENVARNFKVFIKHRHLIWVNKALDNLAIIASTPGRRAVLAEHQDLVHLSLNLSVAHDLGFLIHESNFDALCDHYDPSALFIVLSRAFRLHMNHPEAALFTPDNLQDTFGDIISIVSRRAIASTLEGMNDRILTVALLREIFDIAERERTNPEAAQQQIIARLRRVPRESESYVDTHAESVHSSTSALAQKLKNRYGSNLNLDKAILELKKGLNRMLAQENFTKDKIDLIKHCLERITSAELSLFREEESGVNIKELLVLIWTAFKDQDRMIATSADAKTQLLEALYQIEYGESKSPICPRGTFNKLIEAGWGLHLDMNILVVDKVVARWKLYAVVREGALNYLNSVSPHECLTLLQAIREPSNAFSIEPIWEPIKNWVYRELDDEFSSILTDEELDTGKDVALSEAHLKDLESRLSPSP